MFEDYDSFSCMLSVLHYIENLNIERIRSKKELYEHMRSLIELLCKDRESRMYFVSMSGERGLHPLKPLLVCCARTHNIRGQIRKPADHHGRY